MKLLITLLVALMGTGTAYQAKPKSEVKVYICTGPQSKRYHATSNCRGLGSCSKEIKCVTLSTARKMGRTPCGWCY